jgi:3D (Asp-Asp-Asp) domain-containing protein
MKILHKVQKFIKSSFLGFSGVLLALNSILLPQVQSIWSGSSTLTTNEAQKIAAAAEIPPAQEAAETKTTPKRVLYVTVTAYSSTPDQTDDTPFITANGSHVRDGIIAANFLKFGTKVKFPEYFGDKEFNVQDRMHPRFDERMDIWMPTREAALQFGIRRLKVEIY